MLLTLKFYSNIIFIIAMYFSSSVFRNGKKISLNEHKQSLDYGKDDENLYD